MKLPPQFRCGTGKCLDLRHCRQPNDCPLSDTVAQMSGRPRVCPDCKHPMRRHLPDGRCMVGGCGHDPNHVGQFVA